MSHDQLPTYSNDFSLPWSGQDPPSSGDSWSPEEGKSLLLDLFMLAVIGLHCILSIPFFCDSIQPGGPWVRIVFGVAPCLVFIGYSVFRVVGFGYDQPDTVHSARVSAAPVFVGCVGFVAALIQWFSSGTGLFLVLSTVFSGPTTVPTRLSVHSLSSANDDMRTAQVSLPGETTEFTIEVGEAELLGSPSQPFDLDVSMNPGAFGGAWFSRATMKWVLDVYKFEYRPTSQDSDETTVAKWRAKWPKSTLVFVVEPECPTDADIELIRNFKKEHKGDHLILSGIYPIESDVQSACKNQFRDGTVDDHERVEFRDFLKQYLKRKNVDEMEAFVFAPGGALQYSGPFTLEMLPSSPH